MVHEVVSTIIIQLLVCSSFTEATVYDNEIYGGVQPDQEYEPSPIQTSGNQNGIPLSLTAILNQRVSSTEDLCPTQDVLMFFNTGNLEYLRNCYENAVRRANQSNPVSAHASGLTSSSSQSRRTSGMSAQESSSSQSPQMNSYSGRLLKRILQNMGGRIPRPDFSSFREFQRQSTAEKRSRLSINGALSSLVDMLKYESQAAPAEPKYAFHNDLLHMG